MSSTKKRKMSEKYISKDLKSSHKRKKSCLEKTVVENEYVELLGSITGQMKKLPTEQKAKEVEVGVCNGDKEASGGGVGKQVAANYLIMWDTNRGEWSFKKKIQYWLLQNMYYKQKVSKSNFKIVLRYLHGLQGNQRRLVQERAEEIVVHHQSSEEEDSIRMWKRAVKILRVLGT